MNKRRNQKVEKQLIIESQSYVIVDAEKLQEMRAELCQSGQELFDISLGTPDHSDDLMTTAEIRSEIARRRGSHNK